MGYFNNIQIALVEGSASVNIFPVHKGKNISFMLSINNFDVRKFDTYTEACEWVIKTVNDGS